MAIVAKTDWNTFCVTPDDGVPILVYYEIDSYCYLEKDWQMVEGVLINEDYIRVSTPKNAIWSYWPNPQF